MSVRTRFAPSPTGVLHVGSVRTALFSWLYAKHHRGQFILRIEDTDEVRSTKASVDAILEGMDWLGLTCDEGPFYQSDRYARYHELADRLLEEGKAYRCTCTKERLEALRESQLQAKLKPRYDGHCRGKALPAGDLPYVIRFKNPEQGVVSFKDEVYGEIHVDNDELDDLVLVRSDGHPTYNFAVVIDDWDMQITHVIRGDDHINNTPRQINLYNALNAPVPVFAHLPMILGDDGKRLSKRHGAVGVLEFKAQGLLPEALLNYLVRLGWSHGDQEIFSLEEMIATFSLDHVSRGVSTFNYEKLYWLNQHYQKNSDPALVALALAWHFDQAQVSVEGGPALEDLVRVQAERCKTLVDICEKSRYFYEDDVVNDSDAMKKHLRPVVLEPLMALYDQFKALSVWDTTTLQTCIDEVCATFDMNMAKIAQPLRVAITGGSMSPAIDITLSMIGQARVLKRLASALDYVRERAAGIAS
ncbi:MAG: glutamate--tRNA ligase [Legionellaceae bacterium]